jgi:Concanavalin A-like lectin/glucanases superfamily
MVSVPSSSSLNLKRAATLEAWVKPSALGSTWRTIVVKEQSDQLAYALYAGNGSGYVSGNLFTGRDNALATPTKLATGRWTHLAVTWDGRTVVLYIDGKAVVTAPLSGTMPASSRPLRFGGNTVWPEWFKGQLDEIRIYNRALTAAEVKSDLGTPIADDATAATTRSGLARATRPAIRRSKVKRARHARR